MAKPKTKSTALPIFLRRECRLKPTDDSTNGEELDQQPETVPELPELQSNLTALKEDD